MWGQLPVSTQVWQQTLCSYQLRLAVIPFICVMRVGSEWGGRTCIIKSQQGRKVSVCLLCWMNMKWLKKLWSENCFGLTDAEVQITWLDWPLPPPCQLLSFAKVQFVERCFPCDWYWICTNQTASLKEVLAFIWSQQGYWISLSWTHLHTNTSIVDIWKHKQNNKGERKCTFHGKI